MSTTLTFIAYLLAAGLSLVAGLVSHKMGWLSRGFGKPLHRFVVTWCWAAGGLLLLWNLTPELRHLWIVVIQTSCVAGVMFAGVGLGKLMRLPREQLAVLAIGGGVCNIGLTLGAYLCYLLLESPLTLGFVGIATATLMINIPLLVYPVANHFAPHRPEDDTLLRLIRRSLIAWPALPLYASLLGLVLAQMGVPYPRVVIDWKIVDVIFYVTTIGSFFGIGLGLRADAPWKYGRQLVALSVLTFGLAPLITWALILLMSQKGLGDYSIHPVAADAMAIEAWMPAGVSTVMLANVFHLDSRMANSVWLWNTTAFCVFILPPLVWYVNYM